MTESYDCDYTFRRLSLVQRHLAPGALACVIVDDLFHHSIRSEPIWLDVLSCSAQDVYVGRVTRPLQRFPEIQVGEELHFRLEHVLTVQGVYAFSA